MQTLFDKIWNRHVVTHPSMDLTQVYMDRLYCHEVTTPQAFASLRARGAAYFRPARTVCIPDHDVPTTGDPCHLPDGRPGLQIQALADHAAWFGLQYIAPGHPHHGIIHVTGPEMGLTLPGMTVVCGDSHTATHGALGALALGVGTSEVELVMASQCLLLPRFGQMRMVVNGILSQGVTAKDLALDILSRISVNGASGFYVEFAGEAVRALDMAGRMTLCNMAVEMGARGAIIAPDETTLAFLKGALHAPAGDAWDEAVAAWLALRSDEDACFDKEYTFDATCVRPMVTYGTNPGMALPVDARIPERALPAGEDVAFDRALAYMQFAPGDALLGKPVDYVFMGSCTNGRFEDFKAFASIVKGRRKHPGVEAWMVPGSQAVARRCVQEGIADTLAEAGFVLRQPGCSACLAMNGDIIPRDKYVLSTSNRNFEGRQGPGARTMLCSPYTAAAAAVTGVVTDPRSLLKNQIPMPCSNL